MTLMKDLGWLLLIVLLFPVGMAVALAGGLIILGRSLYWWARGNTSATSRMPLPRLTTSSWASPWRRWASRSREVMTPPAPLVPVPAYAVTKGHRRFS